MEEFVKGKDVFVSTPYGSGKSRSLPLVFDCLHSGSTPMSIVVVVSPLKVLMLDRVTCKRPLHTGPGISCVLGCPTSLHNWSKASSSALKRSVSSCYCRSGRN